MENFHTVYQQNLIVTKNFIISVLGKIKLMLNNYGNTDMVET